MKMNLVSRLVMSLFCGLSIFGSMSMAGDTSCSVGGNRIRCESIFKREDGGCNVSCTGDTIAKCTPAYCGYMGYYTSYCGCVKPEQSALDSIKALKGDSERGAAALAERDEGPSGQPYLASNDDAKSVSTPEAAWSKQTLATPVQGSESRAL